MEQIIRDAGADFGAELREFNGGAEHAHLANFPLTVAISQLVNSPRAAVTLWARHKRFRVGSGT